MYLTVLAYLKLNISIWTASTVFTTAVAQLEAGIAAIKADDLVDKKTNSETIAKQQLRDAMLDATVPICSAGVAYATVIGDKAVSAKFDFSRSDLAKGNEETVYNRCVTISVAATPIATVLAHDYGMPLDQPTTVAVAAKAYNDDLTVNREKRTAGKTVNKDMTAEFKTVDALLKKLLDKLVNNYKTTQPKFYAGYQDARYIGGWDEEKDTPPTPPVPPLPPTV